MLQSYKGRINRKTFILGNLIGLGALGFAALIYIVPLAVIEIVVSGSGSSSIFFKFLYALFVIPAIFFFFYASVLFVKRLHDIGYPGMLVLGSFILLEVLYRLTDIWILNILALLILLAVAVFPGHKVRNNFGPVPPKKFKLENLTIKF